MKDGAVRLREISIARDTLKLAPGLATGVPIRPDVAASEPTVIGAIVIRTEVLRGGDPAALGRVLASCSQVSQSGLWMSPGKGLGSLERVRRRLLDARGG